MTLKFPEHLGKEQRQELNGHWSTKSDTQELYRLPRTKREMTMGSGIASVGNPLNLAEILLEGMLRQMRKIFGDKDLSADNFLNLSTVSSTYKHRLVYMDAATRLSKG